MKAKRMKNTFIEIFKNNIKRDGSDKMLDFLENKSDFFTAPASTRYHLSRQGGLCEHSVNVYNCLKSYLDRNEVKNLYGLNYDSESIAIVSLLHDVCKAGCYKVSTRNVKDKNGVWLSVTYIEFDDPMPYGHGEKSVYIINGYMRLSREEAFAIRYHMGFSSTDDTRNVGAAFEKFPLSLALSFADMEASYFLEKNS